MLTPAELKQIKEYLMMYGKKDSQFRVLSELSDNDLIAFVRSHENFATHLTDIKDFIATAIADEGVHDSEGNPLVMSEENFTRLLNEKLEEIQGGAQVNVIETVKVNNEALPVDADKAVNIDLSGYVTNDIVSEYASSSNKLVDKNYVDTSIAESSATFRGTSEAGLTEQEFLAWANGLTHDLNDYVFWKVLVTGSIDEYIYKRYKWDGSNWIYEYDLIPYYLDTDDYPTSNSEKAVKSSGIYAFTGDVHKDGNNNYISLQTQIDNIIGGSATTTFTSTNTAFLVGTTASFTLTASCSTVADSIKIMQGSTELASITNNTTVSKSISFTESSPTSVNYTAKYVVAGNNKPDKTVTISIVKPFYYGAGSTYNSGSLTQDNTARTSVNAQYSITTVLDDYLFFEIPDNLTLHHVYLVSTYDTELGFTQITSSRSGYKAYKTNEKRGAGTYTYKIS